MMIVLNYDLVQFFKVKIKSHFTIGFIIINFCQTGSIIILQLSRKFSGFTGFVCLFTFLRSNHG